MRSVQLWVKCTLLEYPAPFVRGDSTIIPIGLSLVFMRLVLSPSSQVMKTMPPFSYACEVRIGGRFSASQVSPCFTGFLRGAQVSCMSLHKSGVMCVVACHPMLV